jgi:hypothetical protein
MVTASDETTTSIPPAQDPGVPLTDDDVTRPPR